MKKQLSPIMQALMEKIKAQNDAMNSVVAFLQPAPSQSFNLPSGEDNEENHNILAEAAERAAEDASAGPNPSRVPGGTLSERLALIKAKRIIDAAAAKNAELAEEPPEELCDDEEAEPLAPPEAAPPVLDSAPASTVGKQESFSLNITLNERQQAAANLAFQGKSFVLTGPAGSGKTTAQRSVAKALLQSGKLSETTFKSYSGGQKIRVSGPSIAFVAYTRRASRNLERAIHKDPEMEKAFYHNVMTIHMLLEYEPETYWDHVEGKEKFRFVPRRHAGNPLDITHLIIEESSMVGAEDLWPKLFDALRPGVQIIFIGDINQLQPVFGASILNYALVQLPVIALVETYRNQGIVLDNAHRILRGEMLEESDHYQIVRGKKPIQQPEATVANIVAHMLEQCMDTVDDDGLPMYDPEDCMVLTPYNVEPCGSDYLNNKIAQFLGQRRKAIVFEIIAGKSKRYLAVGDKVMVNKRDGVIIDIYANPNYSGKIPQLPGSDMTRFGARIVGAADIEEMTNALVDSNRMIATDYTNFSLDEEQEIERKQQASHIVTVQFEDGTEETIQGAGDFATQVFSLGYVLTGHKAQGCEWRKVFIVLHKNQSVMLHREWLYTAATRARTRVCIVAKDYLIKKAIDNPRIKGNTLQDKIEYFNAKYPNLDMSTVQCVKV